MGRIIRRFLEAAGVVSVGIFVIFVAMPTLEACQAAEARRLVVQMVLIPGGTFQKGDLNGSGDGHERPIHSVTVPAFRIGKYEVTFAQWDACVTDGGCGGYRPDDEGWGRGNRPVINVSWNDVQLYIAWLNSRTGGGFRLPTESEWEYAARAGTTTMYHFGDDESQLCLYANHADRSMKLHARNESCSDGVGERTTEVGRYRSNGYGLHDMHGNVLEWVQDCWNDSYAGAPNDSNARLRGDCSRRVVRGGSWVDFPLDLRSAYRAGDPRTFRSSTGGFRLAQDM